LLIATILFYATPYNQVCENFYPSLLGDVVRLSKEILLERLKSIVKNCKKCVLWRTRSRPVFGEGPVNAGIMIVGLGPGRQEDLQGRPFVGAAGRFLDQLLAEAGLSRSGIYITNVIKCFLPENRATEDQIKPNFSSR